MQEGITDYGREPGASVDRHRPERFLEAQYRKTEFRRLYNDKDAAERVGKLMRVIEYDVIPQLVCAGREAAEPLRSGRHDAKVDADRVQRFAQCLLGHDRGTKPSRFVDLARADGWSIEQIYLDLLAPAARHVGVMWDDDLCTFVDVTLALGTLHRVMRRLDAEFRPGHRAIDPARRVLLVQPSGSQHSFGLQMVAEFFRRGAWSVDMAPAATDAALGHRIEADWFTVIGFSAGWDSRLDDLAETIRLARRCSANPGVGILVGGPAFLDHPEYVARVGADRMAVDAMQALLEAERFVLRTI